VLYDILDRVLRSLIRHDIFEKELPSSRCNVNVTLKKTAIPPFVLYVHNTMKLRYFRCIDQHRLQLVSHLSSTLRIYNCIYPQSKGINRTNEPRTKAVRHIQSAPSPPPQSVILTHADIWTWAALRWHCRIKWWDKHYSAWYWSLSNSRIRLELKYLIVYSGHQTLKTLNFKREIRGLFDILYFAAN